MLGSRRKWKWRAGEEMSALFAAVPLQSFHQTPTLESFTAQMELHPLPLGPALEAIVRRVLEEERFWGRDVLKKCLSSYSFTAG